MEPPLLGPPADDELADLRAERRRERLELRPACSRGSHSNSSIPISVAAADHRHRQPARRAARRRSRAATPPRAPARRSTPVSHSAPALPAQLLDHGLEQRRKRVAQVAPAGHHAQHAVGCGAAALGEPLLGDVAHQREARGGPALGVAEQQRAQRAPADLAYRNLN